MNDDELKHLLKRLPIEPLPHGLIDRVVRRAVATPQRQSFRDYAVWLREQVFGHSRRSLSYRCSTLLVCALAGIVIGNFHHHKTTDTFNLPELALADDIASTD